MAFGPGVDPRRGGSGAILLKSAVAHGDEESDFDSPTTAEFPAGGSATSRTNDGNSWGTAFTAFSTSTQQVELGLHAKNSDTGGKQQMIRATLVVDVTEE